MNKGIKPIYQTGWFWGTISVLAVIVFTVLNLDQTESQEFEANRGINVYSREIGSGTRSAFTEVTNLVDENGDDAITVQASIQNSTNATTQAVARDAHAISYISLGSLPNSVKALAINGVEPSVETIQAGEYQLTRNFNVIKGSQLSEVAQDFWNFMFSAQAQNLVGDDGFVAVDSNAPEYEAKGLKGTISIVGSTSVEPTVSRFAEAYGEYNPDVKIDITAPGSGAGITSAMDGTSDIGMSSRELTDDELSQVEESAPIAIDGIVVIVNNNNPLDSIQLEDVKGIYLEYYSTWDELLED